MFIMSPFFNHTPFWHLNFKFSEKVGEGGMVFGETYGPVADGKMSL